jgi:hypothetical protein
MTELDVTWRGQPVTNPAAKAAIVSIGLAAGLVGMVVALVMLPFILIGGIILHPALVACGRQGCVRPADDGRVSIIIDRSSFAKAEPRNH